METAVSELGKGRCKMRTAELGDRLDLTDVK